MYAVASAIPVVTWIMKMNSVALPKTYHHQARPPFGTGCFAIGMISFDIPVRSSKNSHKFFSGVSKRFTAPSPPLSAAQRHGLGQDLDVLIRIDLHLIDRQPAWRGPRGDRPVRVIDTAVAGAKKDLPARYPLHRAAQMRAVHRKH